MSAGIHCGRRGSRTGHLENFDEGERDSTVVVPGTFFNSATDEKRERNRWSALTFGPELGRDQRPGGGEKMENANGDAEERKIAREAEIGETVVLEKERRGRYSWTTTIEREMANRPCDYLFTLDVSTGSRRSVLPRALPLVQSFEARAADETIKKYLSLHTTISRESKVVSK